MVELQKREQREPNEQRDPKEQGEKKEQREPRRQHGRVQEKKEWVPKTELGMLVKKGLVTLQDIFENSYKIQEPEIVDFLVGPKLKDDVLCMKSIQKQTKAGQRTRIKAVVIVGDGAGSIGLGVKSAKEARSAIEKATEDAKCNMQPVEFGWWDRDVGAPHTVKVRGSGKCGSVNITLTPAPKGTGIVAAILPKRIFQMAGIKDIYTASSGRTCANENFAKATIYALLKCNTFYSPKAWADAEPRPTPYQKHYKVIQEYRSRKH